MVRVVLFGAPGSGKGTQADLIEEKFGFKKISTGDLIRAEVKDETQIGKTVKGILARGELVSDDIIIGMVKNRVKQKDIAAGYIMDGFPRTIDQARELSKLKVDFEVAIFLKVDEQVVIDRLTSRLTCKNCGAIFNVKNKPPQQEDICDVCGGVLETRMDDNEETIRNRIEVYKKQTGPVIDYYRELGTLYEIDAGIPVGKIFAAIQGILA